MEEDKDIVPFEIAKKLEEKGFNEPCIAHYSGGELYYNSFDVHGEDEYIDYNISIDVRDLLLRKGLLAPTISQVLKWLREEKGLHIGIAPCFYDEWECDVYKIKGNEFCWSDYSFNSYEQAAVAGIEYVVENLI